MDNRAAVLIELLIRVVQELRNIEYKRHLQQIENGNLTPEESLMERLLEKDEVELLALMRMPTHPTSH